MPKKPDETTAPAENLDQPQEQPKPESTEGLDLVDMLHPAGEANRLKVSDEVACYALGTLADGKTPGTLGIHSAADRLGLKARILSVQTHDVTQPDGSIKAELVPGRYRAELLSK